MKCQVNHPWFLWTAIGLAAVGGAALLAPAQSQTPAPGGQPVHGLRGHYYGAEVGFSYDEYSLPRPGGAPYATRVDSQVAFGRGKGFVKNGGQRVWWPPIPTGGHLGVIWKGFIRLPKAGTYVFATASDDASAVYLNDARVALNGYFGGFLLPDGFVYDDPAAPAHYTNWRSSYLVPVTVEAPRILPIEVRFATSNLGGLGHGIDLYWVTPDARRDAQGKPIAQIVPAAALYVDPPEPIATPAVRGANSTISSDFFYLPSDGQTYATLSVRLADRHGRPVAGKRVRVSGLAGYGPAPEIVQPDKPTDANGVTTAKVRAQHEHDSKFFATDVTDFVDVAQVAHLRFVAPAASFLPWTYAPYYDDQQFRVAPLPLAVGRPVTITVPLTNRDKAFPADLTATFLASEPVIGRTGWAEIGKVRGMRLKPGESKEISVTWTPTKVTGHLCFRINLTGRYLPKAAAMPGWFASAERFGWFGSLRSAQAAEGEETPLQSIQRNMGPVGCPLPLSFGPEADIGFPMHDPPYTHGGLKYVSTPDRKGTANSYEEPSRRSRVVSQPPAGLRVVYNRVIKNGGTKWYRIHPPGQTPGWIPEGNLADQWDHGDAPRTPIDPKLAKRVLVDVGSSLCSGDRG